MTKLLLLFGLFVCGGAFADTTNYTQFAWGTGTSTPGNCNPPAAFYRTDTTTLYVCTSANIFVSVSSAGGGATIPNTTSALKGDGAGNGLAITGTGTNCVHVDGTSVSCTTGAFSDATSANIIGLFTSCSGSQYLGADGICHDAAGAGTVESIATSCGITGGPITTSGTVSGSMLQGAHNGTYTVLSTDCGLMLTGASTSTWTLPNAGSAGFPAGWFVHVNNVAATASITITTGNGFYGQGLSGSNTLVVPAGYSVTLQSGSSGVAWYILNFADGGVVTPPLSLSQSLNASGTINSNTITGSIASGKTDTTGSNLIGVSGTTTFVGTGTINNLFGMNATAELNNASGSVANVFAQNAIATLTAGTAQNVTGSFVEAFCNGGTATMVCDGLNAYAQNTGATTTSLSGAQVFTSTNSGTVVDEAGIFSWSDKIGGTITTEINALETLTTVTVGTGPPNAFGIHVIGVSGGTAKNIGIQIDAVSGTGAVGLVNSGSEVTTGTVTSAGGILTAAAPTVAAAQIGYGSTTAALSNCGSAVLTTATACLVINVAGTTRYIPYF